jgi:hypothetical protein
MTSVDDRQAADDIDVQPPTFPQFYRASTTGIRSHGNVG